MSTTLEAWKAREGLPRTAHSGHVPGEGFLTLHADPLCGSTTRPMPALLPMEAALDLLRFLKEHPERAVNRSYGFCELCLLEPADAAPGELSTYGNPLCPRCFMHHAGECG